MAEANIKANPQDPTGDIIDTHLTIGTRNATLIGSSSFAVGSNSMAGSQDSFAQGYDVCTLGPQSHAEGWKTMAMAQCAHAEGLNSSATELCAHAEGDNTVASGLSSHAEGEYTKAEGNMAHAEGWYSKATGQASHVEGKSAEASGTYAHAQGEHTNAASYAEHACGCYNIVSTTAPDSYDATANAFIIGNGTSSARCNAFRVTFDGKVYTQSSYNSGGADYAEYFEWSDSNPKAEDRRGYFVTFSGDKIRKAEPGDDILGVVSAHPSVVGDAKDDNWQGMYLTDEWGTIQYETVTKSAEYQIDAEKNKILKTKDGYMEYLPILNPEYNPDCTYIPRSQRPEWDAVGMMGKLLVRDDGTCQPDGYAVCAPGAIATAGDRANGYRVMRRVTPNIVEILVK